MHYGLPNCIHSDYCVNEGKHKELLNLLGSSSRLLYPYQPEVDLQPEQVNRTLLDMLGTLSTEKKQHWSLQTATMVYACNSTENDATGQSPYLLMFGREARLPVDLAFVTLALLHAPPATYQGYVEPLKKNLEAAYKKALQDSNALCKECKKKEQ